MSNVIRIPLCKEENMLEDRRAGELKIRGEDKIQTNPRASQHSGQGYIDQTSERRQRMDGIGDLTQQMLTKVRSGS
jgi:hypothetical protein